MTKFLEFWKIARVTTRVTSGWFPVEFHEMFRSLTSTGGVSPVTIWLDEYTYTGAAERHGSQAHSQEVEGGGYP